MRIEDLGQLRLVIQNDLQGKISFQKKNARKVCVFSLTFLKDCYSTSEVLSLCTKAIYFVFFLGVTYFIYFFF